IAGINSSPYTQYRNLTIAPASDILTNARVHALEINGWIDLTDAPNPDIFGNGGERVLSFYQAYDLGQYTGLAVQYSTDPYGVGPATWTTFSDGNIRPITQGGTARALTLQEMVISLEDIP